MFKLAKPFFITCETPLHVGSGNDLGIVDLPIQRERHTDFPKIEGSSLKGSIREAFEERCSDSDVENKVKIHLAFGYDDAEKNEEVKMIFEKDTDNKSFAGALGFTDARILLFPVKSMKGVFAWITCPRILENLRKDLSRCTGVDFQKDGLDINIPSNGNLTGIGRKGWCAVTKENHITINSNNVVLEEYAFEVRKDIDISQIAAKLAELTGNNKILNKLVILSDDDFRDFVTLSTEVITRTKIDNETGMVQGQALFTEEYLPTETIMYSLALATNIFNKDEALRNIFKDEKEVMKFFEDRFANNNDVIQIGGNATIGKGIVTIKTLQEKEETNVKPERN